DTGPQAGILVHRQRHDPGHDLPYAERSDQGLAAFHAERFGDAARRQQFDHAKPDAEPAERARELIFRSFQARPALEDLWIALRAHDVGEVKHVRLAPSRLQHDLDAGVPLVTEHLVHFGALAE